MLRVVDFVARYESLVLATAAGLLDHDFTLSAVIIVAALLALVESTGQELVTDALADWYPVCTLATLLS